MSQDTVPVNIPSLYMLQLLATINFVTEISLNEFTVKIILVKLNDSKCAEQIQVLYC